MYPMRMKNTTIKFDSLTTSDPQTTLSSSAPALNAYPHPPSSTLRTAIQRFASWTSLPDVGATDVEMPNKVKRDKYRHVLSELLNTPILDTQTFGSVPHIIDHRVQTGLESGSFLVCDLTSIVEQYDQWMAELPMVEPFYAYKSNPDPVIAKLLAALGCGFDCATKGEINQVSNGLGEEFSFRSRGLTTDKIVYANPAKMLDHLEFAVENGVRMTVFDGEDELYKLAQVNNTLPEGDKLKLLLRITTDDAQSVCSFSNKFGCPVDEATELLEVAKELGLHVEGVSFHVGSGCGDAGAYETAFSHAARLFKSAEKLGMAPMTMVDIGGGFPGDNVGTYRKDAPTFPKIAATVRNAIDQFKSDVQTTENPRELRFIAEPGRYFCSRSTTIATKVYGRKGGKKGKQQALYIDDGVYGSFNNVIYDHFNPVPETLNSAMGRSEPTSEEQLLPTAIFGPTCDGLDQICDQASTSLERTEVGDWLIFRDMGAYTHTASFVFNGYDHVPQKVHCISTLGYEHAIEAETSPAKE